MLVYLQALGLTLAIEAPVYAGTLQRDPRLPARVGLKAGVLVNLTSHPLAFLLVMPLLAPAFGFIPTLALVELGVWVLEAGLLWAWLRRDPDLLLAAALLANALSLAIGAALLG